MHLNMRRTNIKIKMFNVFFLNSFTFLLTNVKIIGETVFDFCSRYLKKNLFRECCIKKLKIKNVKSSSLLQTFVLNETLFHHPGYKYDLHIISLKAFRVSRNLNRQLSGFWFCFHRPLNQRTLPARPANLSRPQS